MVRDFLLPPGQLAFQEGTIKVILALSRPSIEFFKADAVRPRTKYQKMIRRLLDQYAEHYSRRQGGTHLAGRWNAARLNAHSRGRSRWGRRRLA